MKAIKKINNNVALCVDNHQRELIAFGKGVGFPEMPYEVDLEKITMTFYQVDTKYYDLIARIPEEIFAIASHLVEEAFTRLKGELNPNLVFHLADHIHFALVRQQSYQKIKLPFFLKSSNFIQWKLNWVNLLWNSLKINCM
uniref:CAT RNA binding domain-containing protein n=1 Tax=Candidatus Enterococcus willemsii TaxID=1857215 RepID=UPI00403F3F1A